MNIKEMSEEDLMTQLTELRSRRKTGFTSRKKSKPKKDEILLDSLIDLDEQIAIKVLDELLSDAK